MAVMVWLPRSMTDAWVEVRCNILSPLTVIVLCIGSRAVFENTPAILIMPAIIPPVMVLVSWYVKSAGSVAAASIMMPVMVTILCSIGTSHSIIVGWKSAVQ